MAVVTGQALTGPMPGEDGSVFVVCSVADVAQNVLWNAVLAGGLICDRSFVETGNGASRAFSSALTTQRLIWMTPSFIREHAGSAAAMLSRHPRTHDT